MTKIFNRKAIRLKSYDYSSEGMYFVTVCTQDRKCVFGDIQNGEIKLNSYGYAVLECWDEIQRHFPIVELDVFVVMPNHVHGIISITDVGARHASPLQPRWSLGTIVGSFKSAVTKRVNEIRKTPSAKLWQRNFYEHVICNEEELLETRRYIRENPLKWELDPENVEMKAIKVE